MLRRASPRRETGGIRPVIGGGVEPTGGGADSSSRAASKALGGDVQTRLLNCSSSASLPVPDPRERCGERLRALRVRKLGLDVRIVGTDVGIRQHEVPSRPLIRYPCSVEDVCHPADPQSKEVVENLVGYAKRDVPTPDVGIPQPRAESHGSGSSRIDFGKVTANTSDLSRLFPTEFVLTYSDDWISVPFDVERGRLVRIEQTEVLDSFGRLPVVQPPGAPNHVAWDRWSTAHPAARSADDNNDHLIVFPPPSMSSTRGPPIERVAFGRDQMAKLLWGIETFVTNDLGEAASMIDSWATVISSLAAAN